MCQRGGHGVQLAAHGSINYFIADDDFHAADQRGVGFDGGGNFALVFGFELRNELSDLCVVHFQRGNNFSFEHAFFFAFERRELRATQRHQIQPSVCHQHLHDVAR